MTAESPSSEPDQKSILTALRIDVAVIRRLLDDHLKFHDKGDVKRSSQGMQLLTLIGIGVDAYLTIRGHK